MYVRFVKLLPVGQWVFDKSRVRNISVFLRMEIICVHLCNLWELNSSVGEFLSVGPITQSALK